MCSRIFKIESGTFLFNLEISKRNQNVLMCSRIFKAKAERFFLTKKLINKAQNIFCVHLLSCFFCPSASQLPDALTDLPYCQSVHLQPELSAALPLSICRHECCIIHLLPCLSICRHAAWSISCSASVHLSAWCMLHLLPCLYCSSVGLLLDLSPALPFLPICRSDACYISCLSCPSDGMLHDQSSTLPLLSVC